MKVLGDQQVGDLGGGECAFLRTGHIGSGAISLQPRRGRLGPRPRLVGGAPRCLGLAVIVLRLRFGDLNRGDEVANGLVKTHRVRSGTRLQVFDRQMNGVSVMSWGSLRPHVKLLGELLRELRYDPRREHVGHIEDLGLHNVEARHARRVVAPRVGQTPPAA